MEIDVYSDGEVADYVNQNYVAVKVQLDTALADNENIRSWYGDAAMLAKTYNIRSYPTFVFLSADGKITHKGIGYMDKKQFISLLEDGRDAGSQCYSQYNQFEEHKLPYGRMPALAASLRSVGEDEKSKEIVEVYLDSFLLKQNRVQALTRENIRLAAANCEQTKSKCFQWLFANRSQMDSVMGYDLATRTVSQMIFLELAAPKLKQLGSLREAEPQISMWTSMKEKIGEKYGSYFSGRVVLDAELQWYSKRHDWEKMADLNLEKWEKYGFDINSGFEMVMVNNTIFEVIFMHCKNKSTLDKSIAWMKLICAKSPHRNDFMDTYANLLYKRGDLEEALKMERRALAINPRDEGISKTYDKMLQGQPTWSAN